MEEISFKVILRGKELDKAEELEEKLANTCDGKEAAQ